ncbi:phosphoribosylglycinamide formyltransferase [Flavobacteriaceae bacterium]|nr:phosphoribosylglycinamide formyltransferase [Flavobacteriaceae bacterium]
MYAKKTLKRIILFASGSGTNVDNIIKYFKHNPALEIARVFTNNPKAGVIERIALTEITTILFDKAQLTNGELINQIKFLDPDLIVLAGFLLKIPLDFTQVFKDKIINIHPSLLPKYGGKGMYGDRVHQLVKEARDQETGITIHFVNDHYDQGSIIFQAKVKIGEKDSIDEIANKVHQLEYKFYPEVIQNLLFPYVG